ncbi:MAG: ankyrin repeat domain-containing protein, partial [Pyrinomonadaceae bacterium]
KTPCSEDWNEMKGGDRTRFCSHCSKSVNNISAMTRKQAMRVVREAKGGICVRYIKNPQTKTPVFADKFYQITRRAGITAGVLGASLSLSTLTYAQNEVVDTNITQQAIENSDKTQANRQKIESAAASISGTITDPNGAVVAGATVTIKGNEFNSTATGDENGFYTFKNLPGGKYEVSVSAVAFKTASGEITVVDGKESFFSPTLEAGEVSATVVLGGAMFVEYTNPLAQAVAGEDIEAVRNLIANGENINGKEKDYDNITPLFVAVESGNLEIVEMLLNFGAKINARNDRKQTPLMWLDSDAAPELVRLLIKHGAKVNAVDAEGNTALILAANYADAAVLQILINHDAGVNAQNKAGQTALMNAADAGNLESVRALLLAGADVNLKNKEGETAWDLTASDEIEELLKSHNAIVKDN